MDELIRATAQEGMIRILAADTKTLVEEARKIHDTAPTGSALLGRMLTGGLLMGSVLKNAKDRLTLQIKGDGPAQGCLVTSGRNLAVKGYLGNPSVDLPKKENGKLDVSGAVGKEGRLTVIMDMGLKEPYVSSVPIFTGEIAEDIAYYYTVSEQTPSAVILGVLVDVNHTIKASGGILLQMMPGHDPMLADLLTYRVEEMRPLTSLLAEGKSMEEILEDLLFGMDLKIQERKTPRYECDCSRGRVEAALISLGQRELQNLYEEGKEEELTCHFCGKHYRFSHEDIGIILSESAAKTTKL
ncbi:Chaperonin (heat shock protein 33) [Clostridiaceae bacterium JG1575]|nr:Chaperonin (heat shock protein 33) [Clostridiaceae bacterium JG1575]